MKPTLPIEHLSYSSINTFLDCAYKWKKIYIDKMKPTSSPSMLFGKAFHEVIALYLENKDLKLVSLWEESFDKYFESDTNYRDLFYTGVDLFSAQSVENFLSNLFPMKRNNEFFLEKEFLFHIPQVDVPIMGYIDCILEDGTIIDFKTAGNKFNYISYWLQPAIYLRASFDNQFDTNNLFKFIVFYKKNKKNIINTYSIELFQDDYIDKLNTLIKIVWERMNKYYISNNFPKNTESEYCGERFCPFWEECFNFL